MITIRLLRAQLHQVFSWKLFVYCVVFCVIQMTGIAGLIDRDASSVWYLVNISFSTGITYLSVYILPTIPFSTTLATDWNSRATPYWAVRCGINRYSCVKLLSAAVAGFMVVFFGLLFLILFLGISMPWYSCDTPLNSYDSLFQENAPLIGWLCFLTHHGMSGAFIGMLGMFLTIYMNDAFVAISAPLSIFLLLTRMLNNARFQTDSIFWPSNWTTGIHSAGSPGQTLLEKAIVTFLLCGFMCATGAVKMNRRMKRA